MTLRARQRRMRRRARQAASSPLKPLVPAAARQTWRRLRRWGGMRAGFLATNLGVGAHCHPCVTSRGSAKCRSRGVTRPNAAARRCRPAQAAQEADLITESPPQSLHRAARPPSPRLRPLAQRTGLSKENALLRAELEVLRQQNQEITSKLRAVAEGKLGSHPIGPLAGGGSSAAAGPAAGGAPVAAAAAGKGSGCSSAATGPAAVEGLRAALERAEGAKAHALAEAGGAGLSAGCASQCRQLLPAACCRCWLGKPCCALLCGIHPPN
jgi:hypothetical protein